MTLIRTPIRNHLDRCRRWLRVVWCAVLRFLRDWWAALHREPYSLTNPAPTACGVCGEPLPDYATHGLCPACSQ